MNSLLITLTTDIFYLFLGDINGIDDLGKFIFGTAFFSGIFSMILLN